MSNILNKIESRINEMENTNDMNKNMKLYNKTIKLIHKFEKKILKFDDNLKNIDIIDDLNSDITIPDIINRLCEINKLIDDPNIDLEEIINLKLESNQLNNMYIKKKKEINIEIIEKKET
jgi:hypothetical protein